MKSNPAINPDANTGEVIPGLARSASLPGTPGGSSRRSARHSLNEPSSLYRAELWQVGVKLARRLPHFVLGQLASHAAKVYWLTCPNRRRVVFENVLPAVHGDRQSARITTRELFQQFALKLADLWRYESGLSIYNLFHDLTGWEHFQAAQARGRGVLLVTVHLGNWEFGAPLLTERGVKLQVITGPEPQARLTEVRQAARARWGIETLALGDNPFAAVEIIRRLEANSSVALLMDRPPAATAAPVTLFGRPFYASISAAELARASGCAVLPVYLPRTSRGYTAHILPEIAYDRPALRDRGARIELTQRIMTAFEPAIRLYLNQWYHFVPVWPAAEGGRANDQCPMTREASTSKARGSGHRSRSVFGIWTLVILWALVIGPWTFATRGANTPDLISRWITAQTNFQTWSADVTQVRTLKTLAEPLIAQGRVWFAAPNQFRWELLKPAPTIAVRQPEQMLIIYPKLKRAERYPLNGEQAGPWKDALALLEAGFPRNTADLDGKFKVLSQIVSNDVCEVVLQPKSASARRMMPKIKVAFGAGDFSLRATELQFADGSTMRNEFSNARLNPKLEDDLFAPKVESDFKMIEPLKR